MHEWNVKTPTVNLLNRLKKSLALTIQIIVKFISVLTNTLKIKTKSSQWHQNTEDVHHIRQ